jgi:hypothetical protein
MGRVLADSNVLFPFSVMDLLLALSEDGTHEVIWTDDLLDEWSGSSCGSTSAPRRPQPRSRWRSESSSRTARSSATSSYGSAECQEMTKKFENSQSIQSAGR